MYQASTTVRVRYAETDQMGHVYHGNYVIYHETARVESLKQIGINYKELEDSGILMPVLENYCRFIIPALFDQLLTIKVTVPEMPGAKMKFQYEMINEEGELIHTGETTLFFMDKNTKRPIRVPRQVLDALMPYFP